ncbi:hypothetical protein B0H13DRAFT_2282393 [Mycena leptocephala]|nr:hypothetical protein B0H13DRAFT_2282393 [Mycena leptocephala]
MPTCTRKRWGQIGHSSVMRRATSSIYLFKPFKSSGSFCYQPRSYMATCCLQSWDAYHAGIIEASKLLEPENLPVIVSGVHRGCRTLSNKTDRYLTHVPTNTNLWLLISPATHHLRSAVHKRSILGTKVHAPLHSPLYSLLLICLVGNQREPANLR